MSYEKRLEIECPDRGKKLIVLRIAGTRAAHPAAIPEPQEDPRAFSFGEIAGKCGVSYSAIWRLAYQGKIRVLKGFGRMMVSAAELNRFLSQTEIYNGKRRSK